MKMNLVGWQKIIPIIFLIYTTISLGAQNLVINGNFTELDAKGNAVGWHGKVDEGSKVDKEVTPEDGKNAFRCVGQRMIQQDIKVKPNTVYKFSYLLKTEKFEWMTAAAFQVLWLDGKYAPLFRDYIEPNTKKEKKIWDLVSRNIQGTVSWKYFEFTAKSPLNAAYGALRFGQVFQQSGQCWISDVRVEEVQRGDALENRIAAIPHSKAGKIAVDDDAFSESNWKNAVRLADYLTPPTGTKTANQTETYLRYDNEAIWVLTRCRQTAGTIDTDSNRRYDSDNGIEVLFLPPGAEYQFHILLQVTGRMQVFRERWNDGNWPMKLHPWNDHGITAKVKTGTDSWSAVLRIPFAGMGQKKPVHGTEWRASFCRFVMPSKEAGSWAYLRGQFFQLTDYFGKIIFGGDDLPLIESIAISASGADGRVFNPAKKDVELEFSFVDHAGGEAFVVSTDTLTLPPEKSVNLTVKRPTDKGEMRYLEIRKDGELIMKHCNLPTEEYLAFSVFDPENVRTQTLNVATDMRFFLNLSMQHNMPVRESNTHKLIHRRDQAFDLVMDLPEGINLDGFMFDHGLWLQTELVRPISVKKISQGDISLNRYYFELPFIIHQKADPGFKFFYECKLQDGLELTGAYHFIHNAKAMPERGMKFRTMSVGKLKKPLRRFFMDIGLIDAKVLRNWFPKDTIKHYKQMGYNRLSVSASLPKNMEFYKGDNPRSMDDFYDVIFQEMKDAGDWIFICSNCTNISPRVWQWTNNDPEARSVDYDGKPGPLRYGYPSLCPSYRGAEYKKWLDQLPRLSVFSKYKSTWMDLDLEFWLDFMWDKICFCPRCLELFKEYCRKNGHADLTGMNIGAEVKKGENKELIKLWTDFKRGVYEEFLRTVPNGVKEAVRGNPSTSPLNQPFTYSEAAAPSERVADGIFDFYFSSEFYGSPDAAYANYTKLWGKAKRKDLYCSNTFGQTGSCPDFHLLPVHVKENMFEMAIFGLRGNAIYFQMACEPLRQKMILEAVNAIAPFEDIILDGDYVERASSDNKALLLSSREYQDELLLAVRAYSASNDLEGKIRLQGIKHNMSVYDCDTGEKLGTVTPKSPEFKIRVGKNRCRLLYAGSEEQWRTRTK